MMPETSATEWCLGIPLVGERTLSGDERADMRRMAVRLRRKAIGVWVLYLTLIGIFSVVAAHAAPSAEAEQGVLGVAAILLTVPGLPLVILVGRDSDQRSRRLSRDVRLGVVKRYKGVWTAENRGDAAMSRLRRLELVPEEGAVWTVEVLPASRRVWAVGGERVFPWVVAYGTDVADTPAFATLAAEWLEPVEQNEEAEVLGGGRELSEAERRELSRHAIVSWLARLPLAVGLTAWVSMPITVLFMQRHLNHAVDYVDFVFLAVLTVGADGLLVVGVLQARQLAADGRLGRVLIFRIDWKPLGDQVSTSDMSCNLDDPSELEEDGQKAEVHASQVVELLPMSRRVWTEEGIAAAWRRHRP